MGFFVTWLVIIAFCGMIGGIFVLACSWNDIGYWVYNKLDERGWIKDYDLTVGSFLWNLFGGVLVFLFITAIFAGAIIDAKGGPDDGSKTTRASGTLEEEY